MSSSSSIEKVGHEITSTKVKDNDKDKNKVKDNKQNLDQQRKELTAKPFCFRKEIVLSSKTSLIYPTKPERKAINPKNIPALLYCWEEIKFSLNKSTAEKSSEAEATAKKNK